MRKRIDSGEISSWSFLFAVMFFPQFAEIFFCWFKRHILSLFCRLLRLCGYIIIHKCDFQSMFSCSGMHFFTLFFSPLIWFNIIVFPRRVSGCMSVCVCANMPLGALLFEKKNRFHLLFSFIWLCAHECAWKRQISLKHIRVLYMYTHCCQYQRLTAPRFPFCGAFFSNLLCFTLPFFMGARFFPAHFQL